MSDASDQLLRQAAQARREDRLDDAKRDLIEAVDLSRNSGVQSELAKALTALGQIERDLHHHDAGLQHYEEAVTIYRTEGDALKLAHTIRHAGDILSEDMNGTAAQRERAELCFREALDLYRKNKQTPLLDLANAIRGFALLKENAGETTEAIKLWEEARNLYWEVNVEVGYTESSRRIAVLQKP